MTNTKEFEREITYNNLDYIVTLEVTAELVDESFDHEFGTESASGVEIIEIEITELYSCRINRELKGKRLIKKIEEKIDMNEYADEFDYDEFY